ncbi:oxysterol-binding protein-related protein 4C-like [Malania oleifera]|uniref:oxysterol-binding protein-related protein 4C-like n=1 Tax=Malania oleifera TaxID=397392 RepID=UPI0025AD9D89|nr:oxysterol-binding protein-related protein 4C-like [Malania oleifera]XP_057980817.1 oxysterol-binding protein-related protein 4C-like [Malania oleifera]
MKKMKMRDQVNDPTSPSPTNSVRQFNKKFPTSVTEETGEGVKSVVVLTPPLSLDEESAGHYRVPNLLQRILSLFSNVRPGSELTRFQLPPLFNIPKSQLQCYGESVYSVGDDILTRCFNGNSSLERFASVVAWSISALRPLIFGVAPYNPILGETHHVSRGSLNVLLEQVSHHPPVTALHATDEENNVEIICCQHPVSKFHGASIETEVIGKRQLKLLNLGENYVMNSPKLLVRLLPVPCVDWVGTVRIRCEETSLQAELCYRGSFLGRRGNQRSVKGKIFESSSSNTIFEIDGHWDRIVTMKRVSDGELKVLHNAKEVISGLKTPTVKDPEGVWPSESVVVWGEVNRGILSKDWEKAREAKKAIEERERKLLRERESNGETWAPKHFTVSHIEKGGWDCSPIQNSVPPAPIVAPI